MRLKLVSSLEKCFLDEDFDTKTAYSGGSMLMNEVFHFGACFDEEMPVWNNVPYTLEVDSPLSAYIRVYTVEHVPSQMPVYRDRCDENYLRTTPGLYPDVLIPLNEPMRIAATNTLRSLFIEVMPNGQADAGVYPIVLRARNAAGEITAEAGLTLEIIDATLPEQALINTEWFHCDCLQTYYGTEAFDEQHWTIIENFMATAAKHGMNMILTPIFTPPLDTYVGGERPTTQLIDITVDGGVYHFDFSKLGRWIALCDKVGIRYLEIAHFFTQWGAAHAPKIVATVDGAEQRIFGWDTDAASDKYRRFLHALIPAMLTYLRSQNGADRRCWFHISDEPEREHLEQYRTARDTVKALLAGYPIIDALSNYAFYAEGVVDRPVVATDHVEPFLEHGVPALWVYYCCGQSVGVSNRFMAMPAARNRVIGLQLYKYDIAGFLQWGYNFYNNQFSYHPINPYVCTDGEYFVPSGDTFSVYPAPDGTAYASTRLAVFWDALQDLRALKLCEQLYDKDTVMRLVEQDIEPITFSSYPHSADWLLTVRERINQAIKAAL